MPVVLFYHVTTVFPYIKYITDHSFYSPCKIKYVLEATPAATMNETCLFGADDSAERVSTTGASVVGSTGAAVG